MLNECGEQFVLMFCNGLARTTFVSNAIVNASEACPGGFLASIVVPIMDSHSTDWISYPIFLIVEGKPLNENRDWIKPAPFVFILYTAKHSSYHSDSVLFNSGLRNTFWAALLYFVFSGRAFGCFLPEPIRFWLANAGVCVPLVYEAIFNMALGTGTSVLGFVEAPLHALVVYIQNTRDKINESYRKNKSAADKKQEPQQEEKAAEEKKDQ